MAKVTGGMTTVTGGMMTGGTTTARGSTKMGGTTTATVGTVKAMEDTTTAIGSRAVASRSRQRVCGTPVATRGGRDKR